MSQDELGVMDGGKCILMLRGVRPFKSNKFDITKHENYTRLKDYDNRSIFNIEQYIKNRREHKKILNKNSVVTVYEF